MSARRMVRIERTGTGVHDWKLSFDDGSPLPPIRAFSINVEANELPEVVLEVTDAAFEGTLPASWRVDFDTLAAMVADAGLEMNALGELGAREKIIATLQAKAAALTEATQIMHRGWNTDLAELRAEKQRVVELRQKLDLEREQRAADKAKAAARETELINEIARARRAAELQKSIAENAKLYAKPVTASDVCNKMLDAVRADMTKAHLAEKRALQEEINALKSEIGAVRYLRLNADDAITLARKYAEENHILKRRLALSATGAGALVDDIRDRLASTTLIEGEPVLHTYDRVSGEALEVFTSTPEQAAAQTRRVTMIVAPCGRSAEALRRQIGPSDEIIVMPIQSLYGSRADTVIVLPPTREQAASAGFMVSYETALRDSVPCRVKPGGKLIRL